MHYRFDSNICGTSEAHYVSIRPAVQSFVLQQLSVITALCCVLQDSAVHNLTNSWAEVWQHNMQERDFTVNAMMYDPFSRLLFDYMGGMADCSRRRLHTCKPAEESFSEDPVRILRAVRLSARAGEITAAC